MNSWSEHPDDGKEPRREPEKTEPAIRPEELPAPDAGRQETGAPAPKQTDTPYAYRWSYAEQCAYENAGSKQKKHNGAWVYAVVMTVVFLACLGILIATLFLNSFSSPRFSGDALSTAEIAEMVNPATVLVYGSGATSYGYGTGFFIRKDGYIATNYHVVQNYTNLSVTLYSGNVLEAELVGFSAADDLAVLKVKGTDFPTVTVGNSDALKIGDTAIAIGNPAGAVCSWTTTQGIISALNREVTVTDSSNFIEEMFMIQTDAQVNPGNSGGPLCNDRGEVIGVVTRKLTDYEGLGLAIPINGAMEILDAIVRTGNANGVHSSVSKVRPTIGITGGSITAGDSYTDMGENYKAGRDGVLVSSVSETGASKNLLKVCDIIIAVDGKKITDMEGLKDVLYTRHVGDTVQVTVWRDGGEVTVPIVLGVTG